ncbi:MAG: hypothetical protein ACPGXL_10625 [Chitinophagales bacterium]
MIQRDFILREIQQLVQWLGILIGLRQRGEHNLALQKISQAFDKLPVDETGGLPTEKLNALLDEGVYDLETLEFTANLYVEKGLNLLELEQENKAYANFEQAKIMYQLLKIRKVALNWTSYDNMSYLNKLLS